MNHESLERFIKAVADATDRSSAVMFTVTDDSVRIGRHAFSHDFASLKAAVLEIVRLATFAVYPTDDPADASFPGHPLAFMSIPDGSTVTVVLKTNVRSAAEAISQLSVEVG